MKTTKFYKFLLSGIILCVSISSFSQDCRTFAKKKCLPGLVPYIHDGQFNVTTLGPGETAQTYMTFYSGQEYRIMACIDDKSLGDKVLLKLKDANRNIIFDNAKSDYVNWWAFNVKSSQQFIIEVGVPKPATETTEEKLGCVAILVGFLHEEGKFQK